MKIAYTLCLAAIILAGMTLPACAGPSVGAPATPDTLVPVQLRCEYAENPLGIEAPRPRLFWKLQSSVRGQRQTAYHILAASSADLLAKDAADLWDSGNVVANHTIHVPYDGRPLASAQQVFWKVRVWDKDAHASPWSEPARWTMGILRPADCKAGWISAVPDGQLSLADCSWIWFPEGDPAQGVPPGTRYFRKQFVLPADWNVSRARMLIGVDNEFVLFMNGKRAGAGAAWAACADIDIAPHLVRGANLLCIAATNGGDGPNPAGLIGKLVITSADGRTMTLTTDESWKASQTEQDGWLAAGFDDAPWAVAKSLGKAGMQPWGAVRCKDGPLPLFRREFLVTKPVRRALVYTCGLGFYELHINGRKVGDRVLDPGWTNYRKTCLYATYDVTGQIAQGANALGVLLGNGMYHVLGGRYVKFTGSFGPPKMILQLNLEFTDGTSAHVLSDESWRTAPGPIEFSCIYGGEDYDARLERTAWDRAGFDDSAWKPAMPVDGPGGRLVSQTAPPIKVMKVFKTVKVTEPKPGVLVYDLGQNFSGWPQITVRGSAGATVKLIPGELLGPDGLVSQRSSGGPVSFSYTLKGDGAELWHPRFTYYGFRYVQVENATRDPVAVSGKPLLVDLEGHFVHSSARAVGEFACSNILLNRIHDLIGRAIESNLQSVLTDCPHREKLGWLEVSHLLGPAIMFNYDVPSLYRKMCGDMSEAQLPTGLVPDIAPEYIVFSGGFRDSPEWGSASVINPWLLYQRYGDRQVLAEQYDTMKRYVAYLSGLAKDHIVSHGLGDWYDIGPGGPGESKLTTKGLTATAIYYHDITILQQVAQVLARQDDAAEFAMLARQVREAFNKRFFHPDTNQYDRGSQTANAMPLVFDLVEPDRRSAVLDNLVKDVRAGGNQVTAGDVGFRYLLMALSQGGRSDVIFDMNTRSEAPSYGSQLQQGATTLTEAWDANPASSQNHCMLGHAEEWFYTGLAGIQLDPAKPGFEHIIIRPRPVGDLRWVKASYDSIRGRIVSEWQRNDGRFKLVVVIPPNTTATVHLPSVEPASVTESGNPAEQAEAVKLIRRDADASVYEVGAGRFVFEAKMK